ncbi:MAG: ATP-binding protein [Polyangiaceae bacterium]|nr:ATP-binding protein [Polyangiaceae bacterium]
MAAVYFSKLDSRDTDPALFNNRTPDVEWLKRNLEGYLGVTDARLGRAFRVTGGKGSGKTIFVRHVLRQLKKQHAGTTLFIEADCRRCPGSREVFGAVAACAVSELIKLKGAGAPIKQELIDAANLLNTITRFTDATLQVVHEHLMQYKAAADLSAEVSLLSNLKANFGISLERSEKQIKQLSGSIRFDEYRLCAALRAFFDDVRDQGLNAVLFIDNIDELDHDYREPAQREQVRQQAGWVLELKQAHVALIACMRTYYADIARDIGNKLVLDRLPPNMLKGILERRMKDEPEGIRQAFDGGEVSGLADRLSHAAPTPLAYIEWFKALCEQDAFDSARREKAIQRFVTAEYAGVPFDVLKGVVRAFPAPDHEIDRKVLLDACGGSETELAAVQDRQVVLPNDFWNPTRFSLDPSLHILHPDALKRG